MKMMYQIRLIETHINRLRERCYLIFSKQICTNNWKQFQSFEPKTHITSLSMVIKIDLVPISITTIINQFYALAIL